MIARSVAKRTTSATTSWLRLNRRRRATGRPARRPRPSRGATRTEGQPWRPAATQRWAPGGAGACPGASATAAGIGKAPGRSPGAAWAYRSWPASAPPASWLPASAPRTLSSPSSSSCGALYNSDGNVVNETHAECHAERGDGRAGRPCAVGGASAQTLAACLAGGARGNAQAPARACAEGRGDHHESWTLT